MTATTRHSAPSIRQTAQTVSALGLALLLTLATLGSLNHMATTQHGAAVLARAAAVQQAQALTLSAARS